MDKQKVKSIIESLLFINERPIEINELVQIIETNKKEIEAALLTSFAAAAD